MIWGIIASLLLVAANGFFVATEFAIARIRPTQVTELEAAGKPGARALRHAVDHIDAYLAACQLGITMASISLGIVGKSAFEALIDPVAGPLGEATGVAAYTLSFLFAFSLVTLLHVVLGELAPKSLAIARNTGTGLAIAMPMRLFYIATKPVVDFFNWLGNLVLRPFGIPPAREVGHAPHTEVELLMLLQESLREGLIDPEELEFAENIFEFGDRRARQIMVPRGQIDYLTTEHSLREAAEKVTSSGHTRLPLCDPEQGLDAAFGVINAKDILQALLLAGTETELRELARPLARVPDSTLITRLLAELRREHRHLALVVDEHGTTVGLVSLEDILETIVGEIEDEFDSRAAEQVRESEGALLVSGTAPIDLVADRLGIDIEEPREATIGGYMLDLLGRLPAPGEALQIDGYHVEVTDVADGRIVELRFVRTAVEPRMATGFGA